MSVGKWKVDMKNYEILQNGTGTIKVRCEHENDRTSCSPVGVLWVAIEQKAQDVLCVYYRFCFDVSLPTTKTTVVTSRFTRYTEMWHILNACC